MKPNTVGREGRRFQRSHPYSQAAYDAGFLTGTVLLTQDGEMPVEYITDGDKIITRDAGFVRVQRVVRSRQSVRNISFAAGSLGDTRPEHDLTLPEGQEVMVRDWRAQAMFGQPTALVRADALVDGEFIRDLGIRLVDLFQLQFDAPHILYAGGLELGSHLPLEELRPAA